MKKILFKAIDKYCIKHSKFGDRITITLTTVTFSGSWSGYGSFRSALIEASSSHPMWALLFSLFPEWMYNNLIYEMFSRLTHPVTWYIPGQVQLIKNWVSPASEATFGNDTWFAITNKEQVDIARTKHWRVTECIQRISLLNYKVQQDIVNALNKK